MARYVLPVVGAVVGFIYGGPAGASLGWSLGAAVGGLVDPQVIKGPGIGDIAQQTSQEGVPRPIVFGLSQPMAGNIIVSGEPRVVKKKKSGKGGPKVETESVYRTYAIRICEGPIGAVLRVWKNNQLVYDVRPNSSLSSADNTNFLRVARFFLGSFEQNPSPDLEALFGVGTTPAHRGTAYMVMADDDLTDMRGAIPSYQFQVYNGELSAFAVHWDLYGGSHDSGNVYFVDSGASSPTTQVRTYRSGSGGTDSVQLRVRGLVEFRSYTGSTPVSGTVVEGGTPGPTTGYNVYSLTISDPPAVYYFNSGSSAQVLNDIDEIFLVDVEDGATVALSWSDGGDGKMIGTYQWLDLSVVFGDDVTPVPLPAVVAAVCDLAGMEDTMYDVSSLDGAVPGVTIINTYPAYTILQSLSQVFFFAPSNYDGVLHFVPGGGNSVATITEDDMVDDHDQDIEQTQRDDSIAVPRVMNLLYYDVDGGLATDKQTSERAGDRRAQGEQTMQSAVVMESTQAARAVAINHKVSVEELRGSLRFCLPDSWLELVPANPVIVQWNGRSERCRITKLEVFDGYQQYELFHDRQSAYTSNVEGIPAAPQTPPPSNIVGPTLLEPLDIHIVRDVDDNAGLIMYVAISGTMPAWTGAQIELSYDGGLNYIDSLTSGTDSTMGFLESSLPDHPQAYPDQTNTIAVEIQTPYAELEDTDLRGMLNKLNLAIVGDEIIQFANADETSEGHWELSLLLRGRRGTLTRGHVPGERFVLLDPGALGVIPLGVSDIGRTFTFRAISFGEDESTATVVSVVYQGQSQIERRVGYLRGRLDGSTAIVDWQGAGRLGAGATATQALRFSGYHVTFAGSVTGELIEVDTTAEHLEQDVSSLTQPIRVAVSQVNDLTGEGPETEIYLGA